MRVLRTGPKRQAHRCDLNPETLLPNGSLVQCEECGKQWVVDRIPWERTYRPAWPWEKR